LGGLLVLEERGSLHVVEMTPDRYTLKASLPDVLHHKAWAAPALADGRLYLSATSGTSSAWTCARSKHGRSVPPEE
jgi:hypothetical protein